MNAIRVGKERLSAFIATEEEATARLLPAGFSGRLVSENGKSFPFHLQWRSAQALCTISMPVSGKCFRAFASPQLTCIAETARQSLLPVSSADSASESGGVAALHLRCEILDSS